MVRSALSMFIAEASVSFLKTALVRTLRASGAVAVAVALGWGGVAAAAVPTGPDAGSTAVAHLGAGSVLCAFCWD